MSAQLSIVIPTKNRYTYLESFMSSFKEFDSKDIELIIQDNSDSVPEGFTNLLDDPRIKYSHTAGWISVVENCDNAISCATGDYICMLGDDDGILFQYTLDLIRYSKKNNIDALVINKAEYYWPDTQHAVWKDLLSGKLFYKEYTGNCVIIDHHKELEDVLRKGAAWSLGNLPRVYHGLVKRETLNKLKMVSGSYFPGPSPDMANAVGLAVVSSRVGVIDFPAVISGHSKVSTGGMGGEKKHHGKVEDQKHLPTGTAEFWSPRIPKFWSGATIYAESARQALDLTKQNDHFKLNYAYLYAFCFAFEKYYLKDTWIVVKKNLLELPVIVFYWIKIMTFRAVNFARNYFKFKKKGNPSISASSIDDAQNKLTNILSQSSNFKEGFK